MNLQTWIAYLILIIVFTIVEGWFIHRRIENEFDRWSIFIFMVIFISGLLIFLGTDGGQQWIGVGVGFLVAIWILRMVQNLRKSRDENRQVVESISEEITQMLLNRGIRD